MRIKPSVALYPIPWSAKFHIGPCNQPRVVTMLLAGLSLNTNIAMMWFETPETADRPILAVCPRWLEVDRRGILRDSVRQIC